MRGPSQEPLTFDEGRAGVGIKPRINDLSVQEAVGPADLEPDVQRCTSLDLHPPLLSEVDVALHGHDHRHRDEDHWGALVFNPGECAGHMPGYNQVGVVDLVALETEILRF